MNLQALYDLKERLEHAAIAGTSLLQEDFRLRRAVEALAPLAKANPVLEKIRANPQIADIPVVFLTGINDKEKIQKVLALKPNGYLLKPIEHEKLMTTIKKIIG